MVWKRILKTNIQKTIPIIKSTGTHYINYNFNKIIDGIERKKGEVFYYSDIDMEIALIFQWNFTKKIWKIQHGAIRGLDTQKGISLVTLKIKNFMNQKKVSKVYFIMGDIKTYNKQNKEFLNHFINLKTSIIIKNLHLNNITLNL